MCLRQYSAPSSVSPEFKVAFDVTKWSECLYPRLDITTKSSRRLLIIVDRLFVFISLALAVFSGKPPAKHSAKKATRYSMFHTIFEELYVVGLYKLPEKPLFSIPNVVIWNRLRADWIGLNVMEPRPTCVMLIGLCCCRVSLIASIVRLGFISVTRPNQVA